MRQNHKPISGIDLRTSVRPSVNHNPLSDKGLQFRCVGPGIRRDLQYTLSFAPERAEEVAQRPLPGIAADNEADFALANLCERVEVSRRRMLK
jgi:hypothetical protein